MRIKILAVMAICISLTCFAEDRLYSAWTGECSQAQVGSFCLSTKGVFFRRFKNSWKDMNSGLIWDDEVKSLVELTEAQEFCKKKGLLLPTKRDFQVAEQNGIREVLSGMSGKIFWANAIPEYDSYTHQYLGDTGNIVLALRYIRGEEDSVRCVEAP